MRRIIKVLSATLVIAGCLCLVGIASAGVYKWRDANGNLHFSDTPPANAPGAVRGDVHEMALSTDFADAKVSNKTPIANLPRNSGPSITLDNFTLRLGAGSGDDVTIGRAFTGKDCSRSTDVQWKEGVVDLKGKVAETMVGERFRNFGYAFVGGESSGAAALADLHLDAELVAMKLDLCDSINMGGQFGPGSRAYVKVRWTLKGDTNAEPLFRGTSAGAFDAWRPGGGTKGTILKALGSATDNLLGDRAFIDAMMDARSASTLPMAVANFTVAATYGNGSGNFRVDSEKLLRSAVTVKTSHGHGSGVLIDAAGFALTNAHVVGSDAQVRVMLDDKMVDARVVRTDKHADVALLQFDPQGRPAAVVARGEPHPGDPLYVVGTPLDLNLSHTVTQGILSAVREVKGARLYQTDAAVNPGNSGGPVFNEAGELVALTVSGLFNADGASLNVNYLIPVARALAAVGAAGG